MEYLAIGHVTRDLLSDGTYATGGTVSYAALTAAALGQRVGVLTSAAADFDFGALNSSISVQCGCAPHTTTFHNLYTNGSRRQMVYGVAFPLVAGSIPSIWQSADVAHIGPVIGECEAELVHVFSPGTFVGLTAQGWMRAQNHEGHVLPQPWRPAADVLARASAIVFSIDDIQGEWSIAESLAQQTHLLAVTMGARGGMLFEDGVGRPFPALKVNEIDPTGAGDIFASVFFCKLTAGAAPIDAARYSACIASRSVERRGIAGVPRVEDFAVCARFVSQQER